MTLIVDSHSDILSPSTVRDDFQGFLSIVNSPSKFPSLFEKGFVVRPGHENLVAMGAVSTSPLLLMYSCTLVYNVFLPGEHDS